MESTSEEMSNTVGDKPECVKDIPDNTGNEKQKVERKVEITNKDPVKEEETAKEKQEVEPIESSVAQQDEIEEIVEKVDDDDTDDSEEYENQNITQEVTEAPDQSKTVTVTTVKKLTPDSTNTVVTTSTITNENPTITTITNKTPDSEKETVKASREYEEPNDVTVSDDNKKENNEQEEVKYNKDDVEEETDLEDSEDEEKVFHEGEKPGNTFQQQQINKNQVQQDNETQPQLPTTVKEKSVIDGPSILAQTNHTENNIPNKQENLNNTIKDIISSIDSNIQAQENIAALKEKELELLKKQQELAKEIEQQKILAQKLADENYLKQQIGNNYVKHGSEISSKPYEPITNVSKYSTFEEIQDNNVNSRKSEIYEMRESTNVSKKIDLHKIFTPATDVEEIIPKNRKLYASSAFYSPSLHPTVEDQVELARRISHSLSDISNQQSRGQSMYVNRKKRSVKWVHEGSGQDGTDKTKLKSEEEYDQDEKENDVSHHERVPLKFLMNPSGQVRDINSMRESINTETGLLSPDVSAEVVTALQTQKGKGAELFAKRRKVSEKWVVDESNVGAQSPSGIPDYHHNQQQPKPSTSPCILPAFTDAAKHRVQLNLHQEQLLEKYAKPGLKVVQTPWEAALSSGSASTAFVEDQKSPYSVSTLTPSPMPEIFEASQGGLPIQTKATVTDSYNKTFATNDYQRYLPSSTPLQQAQHERQQYTGNNSVRELAYKPSIPQGWKAPSMSLPKDLYVPKEIPLQSYAPPPVANISSSIYPYPLNGSNETNQFNTYKPLNTFPKASFSLTESSPATTKLSGGTNAFPISKPYQQGFSSTYGNSQLPKQQYLPPQSYQKVPQNTSQNISQVSFNPSPLPYDKLAKFENQPADEDRYAGSPSSRVSHLSVRGGKVRNTSPAPFAGSGSRPYTPSSDSYYDANQSVSPNLLSSIKQYTGHNSPNLLHANVTCNKILNAPTYNTSARGWSCGGGATTGYQFPQRYSLASKPQIVNAASMPYTDF